MLGKKNVVLYNPLLIITSTDHASNELFSENVLQVLSL